MPEFDYELTVILDPGDPKTVLVSTETTSAESNEDATPEQDQHTARGRLHNLGYATGEVLEDRIKAFQSDCGLAVTGKLADIDAELKRRYAACDPPSRGPSAAK